MTKKGLIATKSIQERSFLTSKPSPPEVKTIGCILA